MTVFSTFYDIFQPNFLILLNLLWSFQLRYMNFPNSNVSLIGEWSIGKESSPEQ